MAQRIMERQKVAEAQKAIEAHSHTNNAISSEDDASSTPLKLGVILSCAVINARTFHLCRMLCINCGHFSHSYCILAS